MKINHKILSIPPYVSTSWKNVLSLHVEQKEDSSFLMIGLINGAIIEIPALDPTVLEAVFAAHEKFIEQDQGTKSTPATNKSSLPESQAVIGFPLRFGLEGVDNLGQQLQHNPEAAHSPDLPKEILEKIASLSKVVGFDNSESMPKAEPHCNCPHCQILRAIHLGTDNQRESDHASEEREEVVSAEDLKFRDWDISQTAENLYLVSNPINQEEHYNVFLGEPLGCTCGLKNCEHIRAVLNS